LELEGDTAVGRSFVFEFGRMHGRPISYYALYHDHYQRTSDGWKFTERVYEIKHLDTTPLAASAPHAAAGTP
jgi:SnoaL-like domain